MKFMNIALSVVAIAAIATLYSTGAFVSQTHGMDNTVAGFLAISNAEMAQQVGGESDDVEGVPFYIPEVPERGKFCTTRAHCRYRKAKLKRKLIEAEYWVCDPCIPYISFNIFNYHVNIRVPKFSRLNDDKSDYEPRPVQLLLLCEKDNDGNCVIDEQERGGTHGNCLRIIGWCDE